MQNPHVTQIIKNALSVPTKSDKALFSAVRAIGLNIIKKDGEYRISYPKLSPKKEEATAYYTE